MYKQKEITDIWREVLTGSRLDESNILKKLEDYGVSAHDKCFLVLNVAVFFGKAKINRYFEKSAEIYKLLESEIIEHLPCYFVKSGENNAFIVFITEESQYQAVLSDIEDFFNNFTSKIYKQYSAVFLVGLSDLCNSATEVFHGGKTAKQYVRYGSRVKNTKVVWCVKNPPENIHFYYPPEVQSRLLGACERGDIKTVESVMETLKKENILTPMFSFRFLYMELCSTVFKVLRSAGATTDVISEFYERLSCAYNHLNTIAFIDFTKEKLVEFLHNLEGKENALCRRMFSFIEENYSNPMLGRQMFAEHFFISEQYASLFFKLHTNCSFHHYVLKVRMEVACNLLRDTDYTIDKVAKKSGYTSAASFRRVFKDYVGMSPTEYRRSTT